jgi:hypothetical protein
MPRVELTDFAARLVPAALAMLLVACGPAASTDAPATSTGAPAATPGPVGGALAPLPGVEGFAYRQAPQIVPGFVDGADESLAGAAEVEVIQAAIASRGDDDVSVIAFGFPTAGTDTQAVDYFARIVDGIEDGMQVGAERGLDGEAYILTSEGRTTVLAPWARTDFLVFLFLNGPTEATQDLAAAILNAVD